MALELRAAILVVSTTASKDPSTDACDAVLRRVFEVDGERKWSIAETKIVPDVAADIRSQILRWTDNSTDSPIHLIITTGGTGFSITDITPEAVSSLIEKPAPGLVHGMLAASLQVTPFAVMARPVAGVRGKTLLITLPGSPKGARENLQAIIKMLPHACVLAAGMDSRTLHGGKKPEGEAGNHNHSHGHGHGLVRHGLPAAAATANPLSNDPALGPSRRLRASPYPMISVDEALARIEQYTPESVEETRPVNEDLVGFVLAEDVHAYENVPAFRASIVDGYAVVVPTDVAKSDVSGVFPVVAVAHAAADDETAPAVVLKPGQIARITTGAPLPAGANAVVMVESTVLRTTRGTDEEETVEIQATGVRPGDNVREVGSDMRHGTLVLQRGERITAVGGELGLLASVGVRQVRVYRRPVVGVLSTGDELVASTTGGASGAAPETLRMGQVRDTNRPTLLAAAQAWGFDTVDLGIVQDQPQTLEQKLRDAMRAADLVITTGGVSMGELDLLKPTMERTLGGTIHFGRVAMKPGKPTTFATVPVKEGADSTSSSTRVLRPIFALPGNPASALVTFHLFVLPALHKMAGEQPRGLPRVPVVLAHDFALDDQRPEYHRAVVRAGPDGLLMATSTGGQRSSKVSSMRSANALLCMPAGTEPLRQGARVDALLMGGVLGME